MSKNNSLLTEEVSRILEMMGVSQQKSKILNEAFGLGLIDEIAAAIVKAAKAGGDDIATVLKKVETDFGIPSGTITKSDAQKLISTKTTDVVKNKIVGKIISNMGTDALDSLSKQIVDNGYTLSTLVDDVVTDLNYYIKGGKFTNPDGSLAKGNIDQFISDKIDNSIKITDTNYTKLADSLKKEVQSRIDAGVDTTKAGKSASDADTGTGASKVSDESDEFEPSIMTKTGIELYDDIVARLDKFPANSKWKSLPAGVREKFLKRLKDDCLGNPNQNIVELLTKYDKLAEEYFNPTYWKMIKGWYAGRGKWTRLIMGGVLGLLVYNLITGTDVGEWTAENIVALAKNAITGNLFTGDAEWVSLEQVRNENALEDAEQAAIKDETKPSSGKVYTNDIKGAKQFADDNNWTWNTDTVWDAEKDELNHTSDGTLWVEYEFKNNTFTPKAQ
jgi:hypothetical protein